MSEKTPARPRQVIWGATLATGGALFLLLSVFETLGRLPSVELREEVSAALAESGIGVEVGQVLELMRWGLYVTAVAAAVAFVAGIYTFQRHTGARWALSVAAVPILLTSPVTGVLMGLVVAMGAGMLWSPPARDWYAGRPVREMPAFPRRTDTGQGQQPNPRPPSAQPPSGSAVPSPSLSATATSTAPAPTQGYGAAPQQPPTRERPGRPPAPVRVACLLTWIGGLAVAMVMAGIGLVWLLRPSLLRPTMVEATQLQDVTLPAGMLDVVVWTMVLMFGGWALGACVLAELVRRRHDWARYLLIVSAVAAGVMAVLSSYAGLVTVVLCVVTVRLLLVAETRAWFDQRPPAG